MSKAKVGMRKKQQPKRRPAAGRISRPANPTFGPVSTINTAPVAIGNSMRGIKAQVVTATADQVRVVGRDFAQTAASSGTASGWLLVAGFPLTPNCFVSSTLRNYCQMYNKFKFNRVRVHYITSSPTNSTGDVMFQVNASRSDPVANWTGANFLPYALSKPETVIGPQWTNHTMEITPKGPPRTLDLGQNVDVDYQAQGEVFLYSKTASVDSPGYLLIDYDITFFEQSINPKQGLLPNPNLLWKPCQLIIPALAAYTANTSVLSFTAGSRGPGDVATTALTSATGFKVGDIYKLAIDTTTTNASAWTGTIATPTFSNLMEMTMNSTNVAMTVTDGYTLYMVATSATDIRLYATIAEATTLTQAVRAGVTFTGIAYGESSQVPNAGVWIYGFCSYVGSINPASLQQQ